MNTDLVNNPLSITLDHYKFETDKPILTPALVIYDDMVDANISTTLKHLNGEVARWRPHLKTSKLKHTICKLVQRGIRQCKCATTLEVATACAAGMEDVLLAYPSTDATCSRMKAIAKGYRGVRLSCIVDNVEQVDRFKGGDIGLFVDINSGMNRTGMDPHNVPELLSLVRRIDGQKLEFRGLHYYEGHFRGQDQKAEEPVAHFGYNILLSIIGQCEQAGYSVMEVITSGTPSFRYAIDYLKFQECSFLHRLSPGTLIYNDVLSLGMLDPWEYQPAALVLSTVVSQPLANRLTCDAGHKVISADAGIPTCAVIGYPHLLPAKPSEEHLPITIVDTERDAAKAFPRLGSKLYLLPRHVCPTVNNFDHAVLVANQRVMAVESVTARGHERPL